jgi:hypothetical protein
MLPGRRDDAWLIPQVGVSTQGRTGAATHSFAQPAWRLDALASWLYDSLQSTQRREDETCTTL